MTRKIVIETPRLILRYWQADDLAPFCQMNADPKVMEFFPSVLTSSQSQTLYQTILMRLKKQGFGLWAVEEKLQSRFIGFVGLNIPTYDLSFSPCVELSWRLIYNVWGNGYAPEAAQAVLNYGFYSLKLPEIVAFTTVQNLRSQRVMQKIGMLFNDEYFNHPLLPISDTLSKHILYRSKP